MQTESLKYVSGFGFRKAFAMLAALIMLAVVFQVAVKPVAASSDVQYDLGDGDSEEQIAGESDADDGPANVVEEVTPLIGGLPGGSVESIGLPEAPVVSSFGLNVKAPEFVMTDDSLTVRSSSGVYQISLAHPESLALLTDEDEVLVRGSHFSLKSPSFSSVVPVDQTLTRFSESVFVVQYGLVTSDSSQTPVAEIEVTMDFSSSSAPKITANVLDVESWVVGWQVVWLIEPASGARVSLPHISGVSFPIEDYANSKIPVDLSVSLSVAGSIGRQRFSVDWKDAGEGDLTVKLARSGGVVAYVMEVAFDEGRAEIDPTLVSESTSTLATGYSSQRKVVWYDGYYWAFYDSGGTICYSRSADGLTWSGQYLLDDASVHSVLGFDVSARDGKIGVGWIDSSNSYAYFKAGTFLGSKIQWSALSTVRTFLLSFDSLAPVSVALGTDGSYNMYVQWFKWPQYPYNYCHGIFRSFDGTTWENIGYMYEVAYTNTFTWNVLLAFGTGDLALLETSDQLSSVRVSYWMSEFGIEGGWTSPVEYSIGMASGAKGDKFSAIADPSGTIHIAMKNVNNYLQYVYIYPGGPVLSYGLTTTAITGYPTISLDANNDIHIFWLSTAYLIKHVQKVGPQIDAWSAVDTFYSGSTSMTGLTSWANPIGTHALLWTKNTAPVQVTFGSKPLPYGTPGASAEPWSRDGLTPYGTYFSAFQDSVSPGSGLLTLLQTDVSVEGVGADLSISRIYQQPRYFNTSDLKPYMSYAFPYANLGPGWSLDLPWMDENFIYTGNGQRFIIQWGNAGDPDEFENHDSIHFVLRDVAKSTPKGAIEYYELIFSTGMRYTFDHSSYYLEDIANLRGYDPSAYDYTTPYTLVYPGYDENDRLSYLEDSATDRRITFSYNSNGMLSTVTRPDGATIQYGYTYIGSAYRLTSVADAGGRVTTFTYLASSYNYLLGTVTFPTGAKNTYTYVQDLSVGTEVRSWLVTQQKVTDASAGTLFRQTDYDYKVVSGKVRFVKVTEKNEVGVAQGSTEYIFVSNLMYSSETKKDASGVQMSKSVTWYDACGQPVRIDTYEGNSQVISYSELTEYDNWGNVIFTRNAMGYEAYASYANTNTQNSFQGGSLVTRTASGKFLYDSFDDWEMSDWTTHLSTGNTVSLDGSADPADAPAMKISRTVTGDAIADHAIAAQSGDFVVQLSFMASPSTSTVRHYMLGTSTETGSIRIYFWAEGHNWWWYDGSLPHLISGASWDYGVWYDIGFVVHGSTYDVYVDGAGIATGDYAPTLVGTGSIDIIRMQAGASTNSATTMWIDNVRVYKSLTVSVTLPSGHVAELYDSNGELLDRSKTGALVIPALPMHFPPGYIVVSKIGFYSFQTPLTEIWGGDSYTVTAGYRSASIEKSTTGFGRFYGWVANDTWPSETLIDSGSDCTWVADSDYAVSGTSYHESRYAEASHYHGYSDATSYFTVYSTSVIEQYVWLTDGRTPREIMMQFYWGGTWKRVYWGGGSSDEDLITIMGISLPSLTVRLDDVPQVTGKWLQLSIKASDLGVTTTTSISGIVYGLYGGTAKWDFTSRLSGGVGISVVGSDQTVELYLDDGSYVSGTSATGAVVLDVYSEVKTFPASGYFRIVEGTQLVYQSPWIPEIWNGDSYSFYTPKWYANEVKTDGEVKGWIHDRLVGSLQYQDTAKTVLQQSYSKYNSEGDAVETKTSYGVSSWVYTTAEYDIYGNQILSLDSTGRGEAAVYSATDGYTYPIETMKVGSIGDDFEGDTSWTQSLAGSGGYTYWMDARYTTARSHSSSTSLQVNFSCSITTYDTCVAMMWKEYSVGKIFDVSLWMYLETYYHQGSSGDTMDSGLKMRLYDSSGSNYETYSYWLACWSGATDNKTTSDPNVKKIWGKPTTNTWLNPKLSPQADWPNADWGRCVKVKLELYVYASFAYGDSFKIYFDDLTTSGEKTKYVHDVNTGNLLSSTDALNRVTRYDYDNLGRVTRVTNPGETFRTIVYNDTSRTVTMLDELNHKTVSYFDKLDRNIKVERYGSEASVYSYQTYTYNWQDKAATITDERTHVTSMTYDFLGRTTRVTSPNSTYVTTSYDDINGIVTKQWYTSGGTLTHKMAYVSDHLGRLTATREYTSSSSYYETTMTYDAVGNLKSVDDARSAYPQVTTMVYDSLNRLTRTIYPDGYSEYATYDAAGRALTKTDREGNVTSTSHDTLGNVARISSPSDTLAYVYDAAGQKIKATNSLGTITYGYNNRGWVTSVSQTIGASSYSVSFGYNDVGTRTSITYPDGRQAIFTPDAYDRIESVSASGASLTISYNADDTIASETASNGGVTTYAYNNRDWITQVEMALSGKVKYSLTYTYDDVGNVKTRGSEAFVYDWLNRLTSASGGSLPIGLTYTYDQVGNILTKGGVARTYDVYNKLQFDGTYSYSYDANGNIAWKTSSTEKWNYQYNSLDQISKIVKSTYNAKKKIWTTTTAGEYWYDANGARAKATEGGVTTEYVYVGHDPLCEKTGATYTDYVYFNDRVKMKFVGSDTYFYFQDALGSTKQVWKLGATKVSFSATTYEPFGKPVGVTGAEKITFAGEILVAGAGPAPGIYYIGARWYDPELGRWLSLDSELGGLGAPQTMNRYAYCVNNPMKFTDPTGRFLNLIAAVVGAATGFVASTIIYAVEVALTDKEWDWGEWAVEAAAGAVAGAVTGLLMNPAAGLAAQAGVKAALKGTQIAAKVGLKIAGKTIEKLVSGGLSGMVGGAVKYVTKGGLNIARGVDPQMSWKGFGESILLGGIGGAAGSYVGGKVGNMGGKYVDRMLDGIHVREALGKFEISGSVIGSQLVSKLISGSLPKARGVEIFTGAHSVSGDLGTYS